MRDTLITINKVKQTFFEKLLALFLKKYQHLYKTLLTQLLPFMGFYHRLKYLHNLQNHPVYILSLFSHTVFN
jgi:hypothetical protein